MTEEEKQQMWKATANNYLLTDEIGKFKDIQSCFLALHVEV